MKLFTSYGRYRGTVKQLTLSCWFDESNRTSRQPARTAYQLEPGSPWRNTETRQYILGGNMALSWSLITTRHQTDCQDSVPVGTRHPLAEH